MPERQFRRPPFSFFLGKYLIGLVQFLRPLGDQLFEMLVDPTDILLRPSHPEQRVDGGNQLVGFDRLHKIGIGTAVERTGTVGNSGEGGGGLQYYNLWKTRFNFATNLDAARVRQLDIKQNQMGVMSLRQGERVASVTRLMDVESLPPKNVAFDVARRLIVVDDQDAANFVVHPVLRHDPSSV